MALSVGDLLRNRYKIVKHLGRGSRGDVYLAEDQRLGRRVAVKHLRPGSVRGQADVERFREEARVIARLQHENVLAIHDAIEESEENYYLVIEYADEGSVADLLQRHGRLPVLQALELGLAAVRALEAVHAEGILHGDIKPGNILLTHTRSGIKAKLADFGLSRVVVEGEADHSAYFGSILYAAPERLREETPDGRADLYALGAVLCEMLTGRPPFPFTADQQDVTQVIHRHLDEAPVPPSHLNPDVSLVVDELVLKALAKSPQERYPDAHTMAQAIEHAIEMHQAWQERTETTYKQGLAYEAEGHWEEAIACFETVLQEQPGHPDAQSRLEQAQKHRDWEAQFERGRQAYDGGDWAEAVTILSQVVAHNTDYARGDATTQLVEAQRQLDLAQWYQQAQAHEQAEQWSQAVNLYLKILTVESDYGDATARLARAAEQQKRQELYVQGQKHLKAEAWDEAVKTLQELDANYKDTAQLLAQARKQKRLHELYTQATQALSNGEWQTASEAFRQVVQIEPAYKDAAVKRAIAERQAELADLYRQAQAQMEAQEWTVAAGTLQDIKDRSPSYQDVDLLLKQALDMRQIADLYQEGLLFYELKEWEQAIQRLEQVERLQPDYCDIEHLLAEIKRVQRVQVLFEQARQLEAQGEWHEAIAVYSDIIKQDPNHRDAKVGLARASTAALRGEAASEVERRERNVAVVGALLVIAALSCMLFVPLSMGAGLIVSSSTPETPTVKATRMPDASPSLPPVVSHTVAATPTLTPSPRPTTSTPTATRPSTSTPSRTHTPTPTATATPTSTATPIPTPTPTSIRVTPTRTPMPPLPTYASPVLEPVSIIGCNVTFKWSWSDRTLASDEWFAVRVGIGEPHSVAWVKEQTYIYSLQQQCTQPGDYSWEIAICRGDPNNDGHCNQVDGTELAVSGRGSFGFGGCACPTLEKSTPPP